MKKFVSVLAIIVSTAIFPGNSFAHPGALDKLGGHFRKSDCTYLLHEPTPIAMQAKDKAALAQLIKKYNSNSECVRQLTLDKIDLQGHTLGGTSSSAASSPKQSTNQSSSLQLGQKYPAKLVTCIDGDTARFMVNGREYTTRFLFIDTPESTIQVEPYGKEASRFTCSRLSRGDITLETDGSTLFDKYRRLLAWVWVGDKLLQEEIAKAGLVEDFYDYGDYKYEDRIRKAMDEAKQAGAGMYGASSPKMHSANQQTKSEGQKPDIPSPDNEQKNQQADQETTEKETSDSNTERPVFYLLVFAFTVAFFYFFKSKINL
ncbi:hypothetical protein PTHTG4_04380 [Parageobacillus thermoglucosidasius]|uniref:thermonuclease family protein n=1 Tax=Parageobacillus thermoglucosidasius TaxID=1426 RepID=UPI000F61E6AB|nr:thermonuclease family protein [Parageobacillus thermoglucosidasius]GCD81376.1 hypothetical protein PTHTG4_04380 [Parageobacillus thermoglucosidasius]